MSEFSRRSLLGAVAATTAASAFARNAMAAPTRELSRREPDRPLVRGKPLKICVDFQNWSIQNIPLDKRYDMAARLGFNYVTSSFGRVAATRDGTAGIPATRDEIARHKKLVSDSGVQIATFSSGFQLASLDEAVRKAGLANWKKHVETGVEMGVPRFHLELGKGLEAPKPHADQAKRSFDEIVPYLEKLGVHLDVESHPEDFYERHSEAYPLIAQYNSKALGYLYAIPHSFYYDDGKGDVAGMVRDCSKHLTHVIVADSKNKWIPFRYNINPTDSPVRIHDHYPYKTGDIDWEATWNVLREIKFADGQDHLINVTMFGNPETFDTDAMEYRRVIMQELGGR